MKDVALIEAGIVTQVWRSMSAEDVADTLPAGEHELVEIDPGLVVCGMAWDGQQLSAPPASLADLRARALSAIAAQRWVATQYFHFDGVLTQADSAIAVVTARLALRRETGIPDAVEMKFKLSDGQFRSWNKAQEVAFGAAIGGHVQGCFDVEDALTVQIQAATSGAAIAAIVEQAEEGWPS